MNNKINLNNTHKFHKLISLLGFGVIGTSAIITIPFISTSCGENYAENEVKKCNYTVQGHAVESNDMSAASNFYIGEGIKGYLSGKLYIDDFTVEHTCKIVDESGFSAANIYLPKYLSANGIIYTIISYSLTGANIEGKAVVPMGVSD